MKTKRSIEELIVNSFFKEHKLLIAKKKHLSKRLQRVLGAQRELTAVDYSKPHVKGGKVNDAVTQINELVEIQTLIRDVEDQLEEMMESISLLDEVERDPIYARVLKLSFMDNMSVEQIAAIVKYSTWSIYKVRKQAIEDFSYIISDEYEPDDEPDEDDEETP